MDIFDEYVGIPWEDLNCWALIRLVMKEQFGLKVPKSAQGAKNYARPIHCHDMHPNTPQPGDVVELKDAPDGVFGRHAGVFVTNVHVLHTEKVTGSLIEDSRRVRMAWRIGIVWRATCLPKA